MNQSKDSSICVKNRYKLESSFFNCVFMNDIENPELINNNYNNEKLSNNIFKTLNPNIIVNEKECNNNSDFSINDEYGSDFSIEKIKRKPYNEYDPFSS